MSPDTSLVVVSITHSPPIHTHYRCRNKHTKIQLQEPNYNTRTHTVSTQSGYITKEWLHSPEEQGSKPYPPHISTLYHTVPLPPLYRTTTTTVPYHYHHCTVPTTTLPPLYRTTTTSMEHMLHLASSWFPVSYRELTPASNCKRGKRNRCKETRSLLLIVLLLIFV